MPQIFKYETIKPIFYALVLIGLALLLLGFFRFVSTSLAIPNNYAHRFKQQNTATQELDAATGRVLMSEDLKLRRLESERSESVIFIGAGIVLTASGWLVNDFARSRKRPQNADA